MNLATEMLKPSEAAVVAHVDVKDINRAIDEHIVPDVFISVDDGRRVSANACSLIAFYFDTAKHLTSDWRLVAINEFSSRLRKFQNLEISNLLLENWTIENKVITIDLGPFVRETSLRFERLRAARNLIISDPHVLGGTPVVRGTRVPVYDVAASIKAGINIDRIISSYPALDRNAVELVTLYAEANPARGRPKTISEFTNGSTVIAKRKVLRQRKAG